MYGQPAGAFHGEESIRPRWLERLHWRDRIAEVADRWWTETLV